MAVLTKNTYNSNVSVFSETSFAGQEKISQPLRNSTKNNGPAQNDWNRMELVVNICFLLRKEEEEGMRELTARFINISKRGGCCVCMLGIEMAQKQIL